MSLPERLGRLHRVDRLGVGGFSSVWLFRDDELRSDVAVKALADNWSQREDIRERFLEEARILRASDSDHVVRVYDIGEADGTPYFVMTYADRGTVADLLTEGRLPLERVVPIVMQAGDGLAVLHARGVVHRDIKPQNLLLASDGLGRERVMVADLGVAKALIHASGLTQVVGTPAYMAPEQAIGGGIDERADVHGLAAVAYHLLTGHVARSGGVRDLTTAKLPPPPSAFVEVSPDVDEAILRGLEPDRDDRWPDIASFVEALTAAAPEAVPTTTVLGLRPQPPAGPRRRPSSELPAVLLAVLCLVVALAMFGASYAVVSMLE
ncbi:serine/threonine protein kinase [Nocardioides islandensis]|uniref:non-specific serine/threonine protein kinase n=1 Tax=Nocardioides islandensis TaxID=433663 RepID=A0A930YIE7_9ACTN|nr:serine/threonine-protein kinase [Nocardioides islandensis]MBF4761640.1 serine/threonine protein kinase [Nocardioides islandensis]